jgi:hypothetical protein
MGRGVSAPKLAMQKVNAASSAGLPHSTGPGLLAHHYHSAMTHITEPKLRPVPPQRGFFASAPVPKPLDADTDSETDDAKHIPGLGAYDEDHRGTESLGEMVGGGPIDAVAAFKAMDDARKKPKKRSSLRHDFEHLKQEHVGHGSFAVQRRELNPAPKPVVSRAISDYDVALLEEQKRRKAKQNQAALASMEAKIATTRSAVAEAYRENPSLARSIAIMPWIPPNPTLAQLKNRSLLYQQGRASAFATPMAKIAGHFGPLVELYFGFLLTSTCALLVMAVLSAPALVLAAFGSRVPLTMMDALMLARVSVANIGPAHEELLISGDTQVLLEPMTVISVTSAVALCAALGVLHCFSMSTQRAMLRHTRTQVTSAEWSVCIQGLPHANEQELADVAQRLLHNGACVPRMGCKRGHRVGDEAVAPAAGKTGGTSDTTNSNKPWLLGTPVADVTLASYVADAVRKSRALTKARQQVQRCDRLTSKHSAESPWYDKDLLKSLEHKRAESKATLEAWQQIRPHFSPIVLASFVTMDAAEDRHKILQSACCGVAYVARTKSASAPAGCPRCACLRVSAAPPPEAIVWENIGRPCWQTMPRALAAVCGLCVLLLFSMACVAASASAFVSAGLTAGELELCSITIPQAALAQARLPGPVWYRGNVSVDVRACRSVVTSRHMFYQLEMELPKTKESSWFAMNNISAPWQWLQASTGHTAGAEMLQRIAAAQQPQKLRPPRSFVVPEVSAPDGSGAAVGVTGPSAETVALGTPASPRSYVGGEGRMVIVQHPCTGPCLDSGGGTGQAVCRAQAGNFTEAQVLACYCRSQLAERVATQGPIQGPTALSSAAASAPGARTSNTLFVPEQCASVVDDQVWAQGSTWLVSVVSTLLSAVIPSVIGLLLSCASFWSERSRRYVSFVLQVLTQLFSTWGALILMNIEVPVLAPFVPAPWRPFLGRFSGFNVFWHAAVGAIIVQTMLLTAVVPLVLALLDVLIRVPLAKILARRSALDQESLERQLTAPVFSLESRFPNAINVIVTCIAFASSFPVLPVVGCVSLALLWLVEKVLLLRFYRQPDAWESLDQAAWATSTVPLAAACNIVFAWWVFSDPQLVPAKPIEGAPTGGLDRLAHPASLPQLLLAVAVLAVALASWLSPALCRRVVSRVTPSRCVPHTRAASGFWPGFRLALPRFTAQAAFQVREALDPEGFAATPAHLKRQGWEFEQARLARRTSSKRFSMRGLESPPPADAAAAAVAPAQGFKLLSRRWMTAVSLGGKSVKSGDPMLTWQSLLDRESCKYSMGTARGYEDAYGLLVPVLEEYEEARRRAIAAGVRPSVRRLTSAVAVMSRAKNRSRSSHNSPGKGPPAGKAGRPPQLKVLAKLTDNALLVGASAPSRSVSFAGGKGADAKASSLNEGFDAGAGASSLNEGFDADADASRLEASVALKTPTNGSLGALASASAAASPSQPHATLPSSAASKQFTRTGSTPPSSRAEEVALPPCTPPPPSSAPTRSPTERSNRRVLSRRVTSRRVLTTPPAAGTEAAVQ